MYVFEFNLNRLPFLNDSSLPLRVDVHYAWSLTENLQYHRQSGYGRVLIPLITYSWTKSDIIVHSVVFYEEVGSFSLSCGGCFRGCSYSLYYYEVCRFNPSQQPLILESADLGLHSGHFDSYSFHLEKKCLKRKKNIFQKLPILQKLCRFNLYTPLWS